MEPQRLYKICSVCNISKSLDNFHIDKNCKNGVKGQCKDCKSAYSKRHNAILGVSKRNKELKKVYHRNNSEKERQYRLDHKEHIRNLLKNYYIANKEYLNKKNSKNAVNRMKHDIDFKLRTRLRTRLNNAIRDNLKTGSAIRDLGCSIEELKVHLESRFQPGMTWDNYGFYGWHIDHIVPLVSFDLSNREELLKACNYNNLQPLWAEDNMRKSDKLS